MPFSPGCFSVRFRIAWLLVAVGVASACLWAALRFQAENSTRSVQLTVGFEDTRRLAEAGQISHEETLRELKTRGVSSIVLSLQTLETLRDNGRIGVLTAGKARLLFGFQIPTTHNFVVRATTENRVLLRQIAAHLSAQTSRNRQPIWLDAQTLAIAQGANSWNLMPLGFDEDQQKLARLVGFRVTARVFNPTGLTPMLLRSMLDDAKKTGARIVLVGDDEVLGYATLTEQAARELRKRRLILGVSEFSAQNGARDAATLSNGEMARVHAVSEAEAALLSPRKFVDRYVRAARERGVRVLLLRVLDSAKGEVSASRGATSHNVFQQNLGIVGEISQALKNGGAQPSFALRDASVLGDFPFAPLNMRMHSALLARAVSHLSVFLAGLGVLGGVLLLLELGFDWNARTRRRALFFGVFALAVLSLSTLRGAQVLAALAAIVFPVVALLWSGLAPRSVANSAREMTTFARFSDACGVLLRATFFTFCGAILVVALLARWQFLSKTDDFLGTKIVQIVPLLLVLYALSGEFWPHRVLKSGAKVAHRRAREKWRYWLGQPFTIRVALWSVLACVVGWLWMARSGNDSGVEVPDWEWRMRAALEHLLLARPRTKQILLGFPALILAFRRARRPNENAFFALAILATIGQCDVMNTFCQVNNPLWFCTARTGVAALLGIGMGAIFWRVLNLFAPQSSTRLVEKVSQKSWFGKFDATKSATIFGICAALFAVLWTRKPRATNPIAPLSLRDVAAKDASWPWRNATRNVMHNGVTQWTVRSDDGTSLDLIEFDFARNPQLRFEIYDQDEDDDAPFDNRAAYWEKGVGVVARDLNERFAREGKGRVVAAWNGLFFGLKNWKPRQSDRAFHVAPLVLENRVLDFAPEPRWIFGVRLQNGQPRFEAIFRPTKAQKSQFLFASGGAQCLLFDGKPLALAPYPIRPTDEKRDAATRENAGQIPILDFIRTSRVSFAWTRDSKRFYLLFVKEPDGENGSRAAYTRALPATDRLSRGGWMLSDVQRFWLSLQRAKNISTAVNSDGGDVAQLLLLRPDNRYSFVAPRFLLDTLPNGKTRDATDKSVLPKDLNNAPRGGTLMSFYIRDASQNAAAQNDDNRVLDGAEISKRNAAHSAEF